MKTITRIAAVLAGTCLSASVCFAQGAASPGGGASGGAGPGVGGSGGTTGGISGGGISTGGVAGGISGGGVTNQLGVSGNQGINSTMGTTGQSRGLRPGSLGRALSPNSMNSRRPGSLPPANSIQGRRPYSLPPREGLRDPLGIQEPGESDRTPGGAYRVPRAEDLRRSTVSHALDDTMHNRNVWKGAAYFPRKGMYEDHVYHPRRGTYRTAPRPRGPASRQGALRGGVASRAGLRGDRAIDRNGLPIAIRRTTPRQEPNHDGYTEQDRR